MKKCVLYDKICDDCGECDDRCELDPNKICDNCFRCLKTDQREYAQIPIAKILLDESDEREFERSGPGPAVRFSTLPCCHARREV